RADRHLHDGERPRAAAGRGRLVPGPERGRLAGVLGLGVRALGPLVAQDRLPVHSPELFGLLKRLSRSLLAPGAREEKNRTPARDARMSWLWLIPALLLAAVVGFALRHLHRRGLDRWLIRYLVQTPKRRPPAPGEEIHVLLCFAD